MERIYKGTGISNRKVRGKIRFLNQENETSAYCGEWERNRELSRFEVAREKAIEQTVNLEKRAMNSLGAQEAQIFQIHAMLLEDEDFNERIVEEISNGKMAQEAVEIAAGIYVKLLAELDDEYLAARQSDIRDISSLLKRILLGEVTDFDEKSQEPYILVANELTPSETVRLQGSAILGFVTFGGTPSSHTAILARAMGIPALVGVGEIDVAFDGQDALLNAEDGSLVINPTKKEILEFEELCQEHSKIAKEHEIYLRSVMNKPAVTMSGHKIMIYANVGSDKEIASAISNGAEGVGLLRSEFLYLSATQYPSEETLFEAYRDVASKMQGRRVIIRTLDIGADKQIPYFDLPKEENPALGYRGIRICLDRKEMFKTQLKAILRASKYGRVAIMLPMVVGADEVKESKQLLEECKHEIATQGEDFDAKIEIGIMIETPAAAIMAHELAREVDFFSVGTNDLLQYTLAADRQNPKVSKICENNIEPILRLIRMATEAIHAQDGWIGVCGEMAADLSLTQQLVSIGIDELSVSVPYLLGVRGKVSECR